MGGTLDDMSDFQDTATAVVEAEVPERRACTRCDGDQTLVARDQGMGKYRCEDCALVIGFDLEGDPAEFLLERGLPGNYTKQVFGMMLSAHERRLP
jgi:hypothetical protein